MGIVVCGQSGNFTSASTWRSVDMTSYKTPTGGVSSSTSTSVQRSNTFTPGAITVDGIGIWIVQIQNASGTVTVNLYNDTGAADVAGTFVKVNVTDLPNISNGTGGSLPNAGAGWVFFKFNAPVTLSAATAYRVAIVSSVEQSVQFLGNGEPDTIARFLRTTATRLPNSGSPDDPDDLIIIGEYTDRAGSPDLGVTNSFTVTMDNTTTTDYGTDQTSNTRAALHIGKGGTLSYGTTAATNYYLKLSGSVTVAIGGTLNVGTVATPIPRNSTAVLEFDNPTTAGFAFYMLGTIVAQGQSRSAGLNVPWCLLRSDAAANATTLLVDRATGWLSGDKIIIAATGSNAAEYEELYLNANAPSSGSPDTDTLTFYKAGGSPDVGLTYSHLGTNPPLQAEVINVTRNVVFRNSAASGNVHPVMHIYNALQADFDWVEFYNHPNINVEGPLSTTPANFSMKYCSVHNAGADAQEVRWTSDIDTCGFTTLEFSNNVCYDAYGVNTAFWVNFTPITTNSGWIVDSNVIMRNNGPSFRFDGGNFRGTVTNNRASSSNTAGFYLTNSDVYCPLGTWSGNVAHSSARGFFLTTIAATGTISNTTIWHCSQNGFECSSVGAGIAVDTLAVAGASNAGIYNQNTEIHFKNVTIGSTSAVTTNVGYYMFAGCYDIFDNMNISVVSGVYTAVSNDTYTSRGQSVLRNCTLAGALEIYTGQLTMNWESWLKCENLDGVAGNNKTYMATGRAETDSTIYRSYSPSVRMAFHPSRSAVSTLKLESAPRREGIKVPVSNGKALTASIWVRMSVAGDGAAYNGTAPRLLVRSNPAIGIPDDMVLATLPVVGASPDISGTWRQLIGTTLAATDDGVMEFFVDIDGTAGWVNIDDFQFAEVARSDYRGPGDALT